MDSRTVSELMNMLAGTASSGLERICCSSVLLSLYFCKT
ncbi:chemotaxis protein CheC [Candidatus Woesearchaeota archaeon]|nr:chemotaxis protein CheC [Candidatus Woesearchaeota archaeon]